MAFPERNLNQTAVYWGSPAPDGYGGYTFAEAVEIDCRWVDTTEMIMDAKGENVVSRASVQVAQDLDVDGMLFLGTLNDLDSSQEEDPTTIPTAYRIKRFDKTPTIRGNSFYRAAYL